MTDREYMYQAIALGKKAGDEGEVPVGAVVVREGKVISTGYNKRETKQNSLCHAEIEAVDGACRALGSWRLNDCTLYVTLEPCPMCAGAIINARIGTVVYGAYDEKGGCFGSVSDFSAMGFNHRPKIIGGYMEGECKSLLTEFFVKKR